MEHDFEDVIDEPDMERTALHCAILDSHMEQVKILLKDGADVNALDLRRSTPLHYAVEKHDVEIVKLLLENGANINALDSWSLSPLSQAVQNFDVDIVEFLLEHGADVNILSSSNSTVLHFAVMKYSMNDQYRHLDDQVSDEYIYRYLRANWMDMVKLILKYGANVNTFNSIRLTPLHCAIRGPSASVVKLLLEHGADVEALDFSNCTPLFHCMAVHNPGISVLQTLINYGANVNAVTKNGKNVLHEAVSNPTVSYEIIKLLLENGATPHFDEERNVLVVIDQSDLHLAQLLIQYIILKKAATSEIFQVFKQFETVLSARMPVLCGNYSVFLKLACLCSIEVMKMKDEFILNQKTLFEFVFENCSRSTPHDQSVALNCIDALLLIYKNDKYDVCRELIYSAIKRSVVVDRLCKLLVSYQVAGSNTVKLNYECVNNLAKYLSKDDLINMVIVFRDKFGE